MILSEEEARKHIARLVEEHTGGRRDLFARDVLSISPNYLGDMLRGRRPPGRSILEPLGAYKVTYYVFPDE